MRSSLLSPLLALLALVSCVFALQANLAGVVDWHTELVGAPLLAPSPPRIVGNDGLIAITRANILARINAVTGATSGCLWTD